MYSLYISWKPTSDQTVFTTLIKQNNKNETFIGTLISRSLAWPFRFPLIFQFEFFILSSWHFVWTHRGGEKWRLSAQSSFSARALNYAWTACSLGRSRFVWNLLRQPVDMLAPTFWSRRGRLCVCVCVRTRERKPGFRDSDGKFQCGRLCGGRIKKKCTVLRNAVKLELVPVCWSISCAINLGQLATAEGSSLSQQHPELLIKGIRFLW